MRRLRLAVLLMLGAGLCGCSEPISLTLPRLYKVRLVSHAVSKTLDGKGWALADHKGKVVVIDFWASWCGPCKPWRPRLKEIYKKFAHHDDFVMVGVALDHEIKTVRDYCEGHGMKWLQLHEPGEPGDNSMARVFDVKYIPAVWLVHKDGAVEQLRLNGSQVEMALKEKPIIQVDLEKQVIGTELLAW